MKLFVHSILLSFAIIAFSSFSAYGQASCSCKPVPPGGTTKCERGDVAVCGVSNGVCEGYCIVFNKIDAPPDTFAMRATAQIFSRIFNTQIRSNDLKNNAEDAKRVINQILGSNGENRIDIKFKGIEKKGLTLSLSPNAEGALRRTLAKL